MTRNNASMFICGPDVIRATTGQATTPAEIGSAAVHASESGNIHFVAEDDKHAIQLAKQLFSYLPSNNIIDPPHRPTADISLDEDQGMNDIIPEDNMNPFDVLEVIKRLVDGGDFLEVQRDWTKTSLSALRGLKGSWWGWLPTSPWSRREPLILMLPIRRAVLFDSAMSLTSR